MEQRVKVPIYGIWSQDVQDPKNGGWLKNSCGCLIQSAAYGAMVYELEQMKGWHNAHLSVSEIGDDGHPVLVVDDNPADDNYVDAHMDE